jgi:Na+-transporting NADH:ubiquinone oxidoreductase subunit NqrF
MRKLTEEEIKKIATFGALGYDVIEARYLLEWDDYFLAEQIKDQESEYNKAYAKGAMQANYAIESKILEMALDGDMKAIEMHEKRKANRG